MCKISESADKDKIEKLIIECKFNGFGSPEIQKQLLKNLGFEVSRPGIDDYYKKRLNGERLSELIANVKKEAILSVLDPESASNSQVPNFCLKTAKKTLLGAKKEHEISIDNKELETFFILQSKIVGLLAGNMESHLQGKERLKVEYLKYFKELKDCFDEKR